MLSQRQGVEPTVVNPAIISQVAPLPRLFSPHHMEPFSPWERGLKVYQNIINIQRRETVRLSCRKILDSLPVFNWR